MHGDSMSVDARGIKRGRCMAPTCTCANYSGGDSGMKCIECGHPPGKHYNISSLPSGSQASSTLGSTSYTYAQAAMQPTSGQYGGYPSPTYPNEDPYTGHGHSDPYSQAHTHSHHYYPQPPAHLPVCGANGCTKPVHWEPDVGGFDYCSPDCRNKHLLPIHKDQLLSDLKELTELLHVAAAADTTDESKNTSSGATGKGPQQKTVCVFLEKTPGRDPGFIFHETGYNNSGLVITGVAVGSGAYKLMQNDKIRFLDVIEKLNDQPVSNLRHTFARAAHELPSIMILIKRSISLPPTSKLISDITKNSRNIPPTHILVLRSDYKLKHSDEFGLTLSKCPEEGVRVTGTSKDKPARQCGLQFDDVIQLFAMVTGKTVGGLHSCLQTSGFFEKSLSDAATNCWSLILAIRRPPGT